MGRKEVKLSFLPATGEKVDLQLDISQSIELVTNRCLLNHFRVLELKHVSPYKLFVGTSFFLKALNGIGKKHILGSNEIF